MNGRMSGLYKYTKYQYSTEVQYKTYLVAWNPDITKRDRATIDRKRETYVIFSWASALASTTEADFSFPLITANLLIAV